MINIDYRSAQAAEQQLSNLYPRQFVFDGVECGSVEGVLQSLKHRDVDYQRTVCALSGFQAKKAGAGIDWSDGLSWKGQIIDRHSSQYVSWLKDVYKEMFNQNPEATELLLSTGCEKLDHTIGNTNPEQTILTRAEFCDILSDLRQHFLAERKGVTFS